MSIAGGHGTYPAFNALNPATSSSPTSASQFDNRNIAPGVPQDARQRHRPHGLHDSRARIRIAIYSDRLEVENPGSLPFGITIEDFKAGVSYLRNPVIARLLRELGHMEEWGSGYRRIRLDCEAGGYGLPAWTDLRTVVRVAFQPPPEVSDAAVLGREIADEDEDEGEAHCDEGVNEGVNDGANEGVNGSDDGEGSGARDATSAATVAGLTPRYRWILERISSGERVTSTILVGHFAVSQATANRDPATSRTSGPPLGARGVSRAISPRIRSARSARSTVE